MANPNPNTSGLKPFKPGQSGNPSGGSRKASLRSLIRKAMAKTADDGATALEGWVDNLIRSGEHETVLEVLRFVDGLTPAEDPTDRDDERDRKPEIQIPGVPPFDPGGQPD